MIMISFLKAQADACANAEAQADALTVGKSKWFEVLDIKPKLNVLYRTQTPYSMVNIKWSLFLILLFTSCMEGKFSIKPNSEKITSIRLDGYYYTYLDRDYPQLPKGSLGYKYDKYYSILLLYENGVAFVPPIELDSLRNLSTIEKVLKTQNFKEIAFGRKGNATNWGMFKTDGDILTLEMKEASPRLPIARSRLKIINDSTLALLNLNSMGKEYVFNQKGVYHFKKFEFKPDSLNRFTPKM